MSLARNSIYTFSAKATQVVCVFFIGIVIARTIGTHGNGIYELFQLVVIFSITLGALGIGHSMVYLVKRLQFNITETFSTVATFGIFWGIGLGLIVYLFYSLFPGLIDGLPKSSLLLGAVIIPFSLVDTYLIQGFLVELKIKKQSVLIILKNTCLILLTIIFLVFTDVGDDGIIYAVTLTYFISSILVYLSLKREYSFHLSFNKKIFLEALSFGLKNWLANIFLILNYKLDMFLVNYYLGVNDVGLYSVGVMIATSLFLIPSSIGPLLYSSWSSKKIEDVDIVTPKTTRQILFIAFLVSIAAILVSFFFIPLFYGESYTPSFYALAVLLPGVIFMTANYVLFNNFASRGKPLYSAYALISALIVNIVLNVILIPKYGINGAAFSSTISYILSTLISVYIFYKITTVKTTKNILFITITDIKQLLVSIKGLRSKS